MVNKKEYQIGFRLNAEEMARLRRVFQVGKNKTHGYATDTDMIRELLGLIPPNLFTENDRSLLNPPTIKPVKKN